MYASRLVPFLLSLPLAACAGDIEMPDATGEAAIELATVPSGVRCIHVDVSGTGHSFSVTPGASQVNLALGALPTGLVEFTGTAYDAVCPDLVSPPSGAPTWVADPIIADIVAGRPEPLALEFRRNEPGEGTAEFVDTAISIAPGNYAVLALMADGTLRGWGNSWTYEFGTGTTSEMRARPGAAAPSLTGLVGMTSAQARGCAWDDTRLWCWGNNVYGSVGDGGLFDRPTPVQVTGGWTTIDEVEATMYFSCLLAGDGRTFCWGANHSGQVGKPTTSSWYVTPQELPNRYQELSVGGATACGIPNNGAVWCWGNNASMQFGTSTPFFSSTPVATPMRAAVDVAVGNNHVCAVRADGTVWCWGSNSSGQCGNGTISSTFIATPVQVAGVYDAVSVVALQTSSCALRADGTVVCWGANTDGQLGDGTGNNSGWAVAARGLTDVVDLKADGNGYTVCATLANGEGRCWGTGSSGQIGDGANVNRFIPTKVDF